MDNTITIIGLGNSGRDYFFDILEDIELSQFKINLIEKNKSKLISIIRIMKNLRNNVKLFNSIEDMILEKKNMGLLILCAQPYEMPETIKFINEENVRAIIIEKPGPIPFAESAKFLKKFNENIPIFISHQRQYSDHFQWVYNKIKL